MRAPRKRRVTQAVVHICAELPAEFLNALRLMDRLAKGRDGVESGFVSGTCENRHFRAGKGIISCKKKGERAKGKILKFFLERRRILAKGVETYKYQKKYFYFF